MTSTNGWFENVATKELARVRVSPEDTDGQLLTADLWLAPGAAVIGTHIHDHIDERFTVIDGELGVSLDGRRQIATAGTSVAIAHGRAHNWWNAGSTRAHVLVEIEAVPGRGPVAARFTEMIEAGFALANTGRTNARGVPSPLWLAAFAVEYRDVLRLTRPPHVVQDAIFRPLGTIARALGRDPAAPWLHGPDSPARIAVPADQTLRDLELA